MAANKKKRRRTADSPHNVRTNAKASGLSAITVSRAFRNPGKLAPATLARIMKVAEGVGFVPDQIASSTTWSPWSIAMGSRRTARSFCAWSPLLKSGARSAGKCARSTGMKWPKSSRRCIGHGRAPERRASVPVVLSPSNYKFVIGQASVLRQGSDIGFISTGFMTERALDAATELQTRGIHAGVLHVPTLKPLDTQAIAKFAASVSHVLVAENHVSYGGLASQVSEVLYDSDTRTRLTRIGLPDKFIECGSVPVLQQRYGLTVERIIDVALEEAA